MEPEKELDIDKLADEVTAEVEAEESGQVEEKAEPEHQEAAPAEDDDEKFASEAAKQKLQNVPFKRFDKVYKSHKELKQWRAANEQKIRYAEDYEKEVKVLAQRFQEYPWFQQLVNKMLTDPKSIDWKQMHGDVGKLVKDAVKEVAKGSEAPNPLAQQVEQIQHELVVRDYQSKFKDGLQEVAGRSVSKSLMREYPAVEIDKDFMARLTDLIPKEVARLEQAGQNPLRSLDIVGLATKLAKSDQEIANRILERQTRTSKANQGAGLTAGKGKPAGTVTKQAPNYLKNPELYEKWLADTADSAVSGNE